MEFGYKCVQISTLPSVSSMVLAKSLNLSEAQCYNQKYMKVPSVGNRVSFSFMKSQVRFLLLGRVLMSPRLFFRAPVPILFLPENTHVLVYFTMWKRDLRNTGTIGIRNLISYTSQTYLQFERGRPNRYRLNAAT